MKKTFSIKELLIDEDNPEHGIHAISIVDNPAIEVPFQYFAKGLLPFWKWTAYPDDEVIETSHEFCKNHAYINDSRVYHTTEVQSWAALKDKTFIPESNFFASFDDNATNFNGDQQIFNCRHYLERVSSINEVPKNKRHLITFNNEHIINFKIENDEKRIIKGMVLQSNQLIYRNDVGNGSSGYVYVSKDTIKKLFKKYGFNRSITFQHRDDITGNAILLKSYLVENDNIIQWFMEYKILPTITGNKIWNIIKSYGTGGMGFSLEAIFKL